VSENGIEIRREDPRAADVTKLIRDLDEMFHHLYPAESNHLVDIETLASPDIHFFVARRNGEAHWRRSTGCRLWGLPQAVDTSGSIRGTSFTT